MTFYFGYGYKKRTVIHRRQFSRPSLYTVSSSRAADNESASIKSSPETSSPDKSHSLSPPASASTAPTSLTDLASLGSSDRAAAFRLPQIPHGCSLPGIRDLPEPQRGSDETTLSKSSGPAAQSQVFPLPAAPLSVTPSVATIETAAAAKSFFEAHFNSLRSEAATPRERRWQLLEDGLALTPLSFEEREKARRKWLTSESDYLRQLRVWKGKSLARRKAKGISIAGYEVVRVLGKGSFGLVKLVKEKPQPAPRVSPPKSSPANTDDSDIEMLDGIGSGATSPVKDAAQLAKQVYAMKVIRKSDMLRNCQEGHLKAERDFLVASETSRWVVPLIASFQDHSNLYLVMEYMVGGDFLGLLLREDVLSEYAATWYIAEMILCIEEAHKMNWIHRDVKPDNFLITASGHLKISDFGLAFDGHWAHNQTYFNNQRYSLLEKFRINIRGDDQDEDEEARRQHSRNLGDAVNDAIGRNYRLRRPSWMERGKSEDPLTWLNRTQKRRLAKSVVGTSQYMAPEVIRGEEYDGRSDWWSIGVIMYECLYGSTPFYSETRQATKEKIVRHNEFLRFPGDSRVNRPATERNRLDPVSFVALNFMCQLLTAKQCRLSARHYHDNDMPDCPSRRRFYPRGSDGSHRFSSAPPAPPPQKFFVHPDDAADIKAHPIFRGIDWEHLHLMEPPFVPRIRKEADLTRYFEAEEEIVSGSEGADSSDFEEGVGDGMVGVEAAVADAMKGRRREKKRPRDKLLRDPVLGRCVLEARKKGAFVGYTYRRPSEGGRAGIPLY